MKKNILILLLSVFLIGADSPQLVSYPPQKIMGFRGLDTRSTAPTIADSRAEDLQNVRISEAMDLQKRYGYDNVNNFTLDDFDISSPAITGLFDSKYSNGNSWTLAFLGNKIKYDKSGIWTEVSTYLTPPTLTASQDYLWKCIMALDYAVCTDDVAVPIKISSTPTKSALDVSDLSDTLTKAKTIAWFRNYLIFGNTVENATERPTRFRWSDVGTIETYQDDNFVDIATFAGDEIIGFIELYGDLYVFLTESIWQVSLVGGDDIFNFKKVIDGLGAISRDSIQLVQLTDNRSAVIFLDKRKKMLMFNGYSITDIGSIIQPNIDDFSATRLQYTTATFDGTSYWISVTDGSGTKNDLVLEYNVKIGEWSKHTDINANAFAQIEESAGTVKTYFGNYYSMVYWLDNPDLNSDVDGGSGILDSVATINTTTITGAQVLIDAALPSGSYTGAIVKIKSGTAAGEEAVISHYTSTSLVVTPTFTTTPDSTSVYSIGTIDSYYNTKWYDLGDSNREKAFLGMLLWAREESDGSVDAAYAIDFNSNSGSETINLAPSATSLWDSAIWDTAIWGTTGDKIYTAKFKGFGNFIQVNFTNDDVDSTFHLYGFNLLGTASDIKQ